MTWTYEDSDPTKSTLNQVRFMISDIDENKPLLSDEEIGFLLVEEEDDVTEAAIRAARHLAMRFSRLAKKKVGDLEIDYGKRAEVFAQLANDIQAGTAGPAPVAAPRMDDSIPKSFRIGMHDIASPIRDVPYDAWGGRFLP